MLTLPPAWIPTFHDIKDGAMQSPFLDILLYAHDGRGTGHVSRSAAIGMALRRLYPDLRVLLVTGSARVAELIGEAPLDCCKLPSYATSVVGGVSCGAPGPSGFGDKELGHIREHMIADLVGYLHPRIFLVDHTPQGKHKELVPALRTSSPDTQYYLGVRAVVGSVGKVFSPLSAEFFKQYYDGLIWYGDSSVLGPEELARLQAHYGRAPWEAGYVSRMKELEAWRSEPGGESAGVSSECGRLAGVAALSWNDANSPRILEYLVRVAMRGNAGGRWRIYTDLTGQDMQTAICRCRELQGERSICELRPFGAAYHNDIRRADMAVVYGGYNSLTDVMACNIPCMVLLRGMQDQEQERHVELLSHRIPTFRSLDAANTTFEQFVSTLESVQQAQAGNISVNLDGAGNAARMLARTLQVLKEGDSDNGF